MSGSGRIGDEDSSAICASCGFCCDATLFDQSEVAPSETKEFLVQLGLIPVDNPAGAVRRFQQPCAQFAGSCSIYPKRPLACKAFRCGLLRSVDRGKYTVAEARQIVLETKALRDAVAPTLNGMVAQAGVTSVGHALLTRLNCLLPVLMDPAQVRLRETYGTTYPTVFSLVMKLRKYFLKEEPGTGTGQNAAVPSDAEHPSLPPLRNEC